MVALLDHSHYLVVLFASHGIGLDFLKNKGPLGKWTTRHCSRAAAHQAVLFFGVRSRDVPSMATNRHLVRLIEKV